MRRRLEADLARLRQRWLYRKAERLFVERLTPFGRALLAVWLAAALLGQDLGLPIHLLWACLTATFVCATATSWWFMPRLEARPRPVVPTTAGAEVVLEIDVANRSWRAAHRVTAVARRLPMSFRRTETDEHVEVLAPGATTRTRVRLHASRRGVYDLAATSVGSAFPLGLVRSLRPVAGSARVVVYPKFLTPTTFAIPQGRNHQPGGFLLSSNVGESAELMHTREYRAGDNPRHVHWPSTARLGEPVVKVYHEEYFARLALVIDTEVATGAADDALEVGISTAAGIADYLSRREYIIDLFAAGGRVYHFQAGRALAHFDSILEILACVESSPTVDWSAVESAIVPQAPRLTGVVAVFMDWTEARRALVERLRGEGVGVRVIVVRDGATSVAPPALDDQDFTRIEPSTATCELSVESPRFDVVPTGATA